jgi:secreted Zn-dependent insulinase-like peptidase
MEETNYFFEISNEHFPEGLKRLADFFRKPILNPDCVEK